MDRKMGREEDKLEQGCQKEFENLQPCVGRKRERERDVLHTPEGERQVNEMAIQKKKVVVLKRNCISLREFFKDAKASRLREVVNYNCTSREKNVQNMG